MDDEDLDRITDEIMAQGAPFPRVLVRAKLEALRGMVMDKASGRMISIDWIDPQTGIVTLPKMT